MLICIACRIAATAAMTRQRSFFTASVAEELLLNTELTEESKDRAIHLLKEFGLYEYRAASARPPCPAGRSSALPSPVPSFPAAGY